MKSKKAVKHVHRVCVMLKKNYFINIFKTVDLVVVVQLKLYNSHVTLNYN